MTRIISVCEHEKAAHTHTHTLALCTRTSNGCTAAKCTHLSSRGTGRIAAHLLDSNRYRCCSVDSERHDTICAAKNGGKFVVSVRVCGEKGDAECAQ